MYSDDALLEYETVDIEVYLADGTEHYFFSCHNDLYEDYAWDENAGITDLCDKVARLQ